MKQPNNKNGPLTREEVINHIKLICNNLDVTISHVNDLHVNLILNSQSDFVKNFEDIFESAWEPLLSQMYAFQESIKQVSTKMSEEASREMLASQNAVKTLEIMDGSVSDEKLADTKSIQSETTSETHPCEDFSEQDEQRKLSSKTHIKADSETTDIITFLSSMDQKLNSAAAADADVESEMNVKSKSKKHPEDSISIRSHIFNSFLTTEKTYHDLLYCIKMFSSAITNFAKDDLNPQILTDNQKLFSKLMEILKFHESWLEILESKKNTSEEFNSLVLYFSYLREVLPAYKEHVIGLQTAPETLSRLRSNKGVNEILPKFIDTQTIKMTLEDALSRPLTRISECFYTLDDLIKSLDMDEKWYNELVLARDELTIFLEVSKYNPKDKRNSFRQVVKWAPVVEYIREGERKPRILLVYSDFLVCAAETSKGTHALKWYASLKRVLLSPDVPSKYKEVPFVSIPKVFFDNLKEEIFKLRAEIDALDPKKNSKKIEKLERLLSEKETELTLKYPSIPFRLYLPNGKVVTILFVSERTLESWHHIIQLRHDSVLIEEWPIYQTELQAVIDSVSRYFSSSVKSALTRSSAISPQPNNQLASQVISGKLFISIRLRKDQDNVGDCVCHVEIDKHLKNASKTKSSQFKIEILNSDIVAIDLAESSGYLYITFVKTRSRGEENLGGFVSNLISEGINSKPYLRKVKEFKGGKMLLFAEFSQSSQVATYIPKFNPLNPSIEDIVYCECSEIPSIITHSIEYINNFGLREVGIYRLSGVASQIVQLGKDFFEGWILSAKDLEKYDVNAVAGHLKAFLRELQNPIVTPLIAGQICKFNFEKGTFEELMAILDKLPPANLKSFKAIMDHLTTVEKNKDENKMTTHNIATVFGLNMLSSERQTESPHSMGVGMFEPINIFAHLLELWIKNNNNPS